MHNSGLKIARDSLQKQAGGNNSECWEFYSTKSTVGAEIVALQFPDDSTWRDILNPAQFHVTPSALTPVNQPIRKHRYLCFW